MQTRLTPRTDKAAFREKVVRGEPVTAQEVFDVAVEGVILQGGAATWEGMCRYRTTGGRECAAGQLIPDSLYLRDMEDKSFGILSVSSKGPLSPHREIIRELQGIHDGSARRFRRNDEGFLLDFKARVSMYATTKDLTVPPLAQIEEPSGAPG